MRSSHAVQFFGSVIVCLVISGCGGSSGSTTGGGGNNNPTTVTFTFSGATPAAVVTQVGSGTFSAATVSSNTVSLSVPGGTDNFGIAWACPPLGTTPAITYQNVLESTVTDGVSYNLDCTESPNTGTTGTLTLSVDASAFSTSTSVIPNFVEVEAQNGSDVVQQFPNGLVVNNDTLAAPAGSDQVSLWVSGFTLNNGYASEYMLAAKSFSGVSVPGSLNNGNTVTFTSADAMVQQPITYKNVPSGYTAPTTQAIAIPAGETNGFFLIENATSTYPALPATIAQSSDRYYLLSSALNFVSSGQSTVYQYATEIETFTGEGPVTVTFPSPWTYSGPTPATLPAMDINYTGFSGQTGVTESGSLQWTSPSNSNAEYIYQVTASAKYLGGSTSLHFPDLSSMSGFFAGPTSGTSVNWQASASQNSTGISPAPLTNGNQFSVGASGTYTVP